MNTDRIKEAKTVLADAVDELGGLFSDVVAALDKHARAVKDVVEAAFEPQDEPAPAKPKSEKKASKKK